MTFFDEHGAPLSNDSENATSEESANVFSIRDSIFVGKLKEETLQALLEESMWNGRAFYRNDEWIRYVDSYRDAADRVVEKYEVEYLVYPIMYLYRHYLELQLKSLLRKLHMLSGSQSCYPQTHDLEELWCKVRPLMEEEYPQQDTEDNDHIEARIREFNQIDPGSLNFRYPEDTKGTPSFENVPKLDPHDMINVFQVKCIVKDIRKKLSGMDGYLYAMLQVKGDIDS